MEGLLNLKKKKWIHFPWFRHNWRWKRGIFIICLRFNWSGREWRWACWLLAWGMVFVLEVLEM